MTQNDSKYTIEPVSPMHFVIALIADVTMVWSLEAKAVEQEALRSHYPRSRCYLPSNGDKDAGGSEAGWKHVYQSP